MKTKQAILHIGKNGFTPGVTGTLKSHFKTREDVKVILLKSAGHTKENVREIAEKIVSELGNKYTYRIVGFTIFLKKWRKERGKTQQ